MKKNSLSIVASIVLATSFIGCSSGGDVNDDNLVSSISGSAVDGYISGATVCLDVNDNGNCDASEVSVKTNSSGKYTLSLDSLTDAQRETVKVMVQGGIDTASNKPFQGILKSPLTPDETIINMNALTTMAAEKITNNSEAVREMEKVAVSLGLTIDDIKADILEATNKKAYEHALKLQKSIEILSEALPSTTEAERVANMNRVMAKLSESFEVSDSDIDTILSSTTFDDGLEEVEKIKIKTQDMVRILNISTNETIEEIEREQLQLEEKRDILVQEINRIQTIGGEIGTDLDTTTLQGYYDDIDALYTTQNQAALQLINSLDLDDLFEDDYASLTELALAFQLAGVSENDTIAQMEDKIRLANFNNVDIQNAVLAKLQKMAIENDNDNDEVEDTIQLMLELNLIEEASNPLIVAAVDSLNLNEDSTIQEIIDAINASTLIDEANKTLIVEKVNDYITNVKDDIATQVISILSDSVTGTTYTVTSITEIITSFGLNFTIEDYKEEIVNAISTSTTISDIDKITLLSAFSFIL